MDWWKNAVFRITGPERKGKVHGTGFACGWDGDAVLVVTCWHVVRDIGANQLHIGDKRCELVSQAGDDDLDLAVLSVAGMSGVETLALGGDAAKGQAFETYGYEPVGRALSGTLGARLSRPHASDDDVPAWDYYLQDGAGQLEEVKDGYSGAPLCDARTHRVVAVITHRKGTDKGFAIDIANLERVYPGAARFFTPAQISGPGQPSPLPRRLLVAALAAAAGIWPADVGREPVAPPPPAPTAQTQAPSSVGSPAPPAPSPAAPSSPPAPATSAKAPSVFRDPLVHELTPKELAALVPAPVPAAAPTPPLSAFRDSLKLGGVGPEMINLPGGRFLMGSPTTEPWRDGDESPQHTVNVPPFALSRTEVSFADYDRFADATRRNKPDDRGWGRGERPVIDVSWDDAHAYAAWLSAQTGQRYRLPSEAEWEYAARAGTTTAYALPAPQGSPDIAGRRLANCDGCGSAGDGKRTAPVGRFPPNAWGLHDLHGNVWEWTEDCWHDTYTGAPADGSAWGDTGGGDCARRVLRGGSWVYVPGTLRSASRYWLTVGFVSVYVGLRLARTP